MAGTRLSTALLRWLAPHRRRTIVSTSAANAWSDTLKAQTRDLIGSRGPVGTPDGSLALKHIAAGFGIITEGDLLSGVLGPCV